MKSEYAPWRSVMLDTQSRFRTTSLFYETCLQREKYPPIFTTQAKDRTVGDKTYRSLKAIFFSYDHVPNCEYEFALDVFGSWDHWIQLAHKSQLQDEVKSWRHELEIKNRCAAIKTLIQQSQDPEKGLSAARAVIAEEHLGSKRGRPSKEELVRKEKIASGVRDTLAEDMERLGISLVKNS